MRKLLILLLILIPSFININAQYYSNRYYYSGLKLYKGDNMFFRNNSVMIGINSGWGERQKGKYMVGGNVKLFGLVINSGFYPNQKKDSGYYVHLGYDFPVAKWITVAPLIGNSKHERDGINFNGFDYGGQVTLNIPFDRFSLSIPFVLTKHTGYIGIGFTINTYK